MQEALSNGVNDIVRANNTPSTSIDRPDTINMNLDVADMIAEPIETAEGNNKPIGFEHLFESTLRQIYIYQNCDRSQPPQEQR